MYTITQATKIDTLIPALVMQEREVFNYQINIDNHERSILLAGDNPEQAELVNRLEELLVSEKREQRNAQLLLDSIESQLLDANVDISARVKAIEATQES